VALQEIVSLYRESNRPTIRSSRFEATGEFSSLYPYILAVKELKDSELLRLEIDGEDLLDEDELPTSGKQISYELRLPKSSSETFHDSISDLLENDPAISRGKIPNEFYLVDSDYYSGDTKTNPEVSNLENLCNFILGLSELAHYHDEKSSNGILRLVFVQPEGNQPFKPVVVETKVTKEIINASSNLDFKLIDDLSDEHAAQDPHYSAKIGVFGASLAVFLNGQSDRDAFYHLIKNWTNFLEEYHRDLSTYLSGFAFHKAKVEVAEAEIKIASEFSKVINDLTGKLLGIPVSLAAVIAIVKTESLTERLIFLFILAVSSLIISNTVSNQKRQFRRISHGKDMVLNAIEGKKGTYPTELAATVDRIIINLNKDQDGLRCTLMLFQLLSWLPVIIGVLMLGYTYWEQVLEAVRWVLESTTFLCGQSGQTSAHRG